MAVLPAAFTRHITVVEHKLSRGANPSVYIIRIKITRADVISSTTASPFRVPIAEIRLRNVTIYTTNDNMGDESVPSAANLKSWSWIVMRHVSWAITLLAMTRTVDGPEEFWCSSITIIPEIPTHKEPAVSWPLGEGNRPTCYVHIS